jgi:hypothetical protein
MGFEPTIPASERAKPVHALARAATAIGHDTVAVVQTVRKRWTRHTAWADLRSREKVEAFW